MTQLALHLQPNEASLTALLKERFGYDGFRRGQLDILLSVLSGRDTLAVMPTGGAENLSATRFPHFFTKALSS